MVKDVGPDKIIEEKAEKALERARLGLVLGDNRGAFFACLAMRLRFEPQQRLGTMAIDGKTIFYDPHWACSLTRDELKGVICHEVLHCVCKHHTRRGARDPKKWNIAADLSINPILKEACFTLPKGGCWPGQHPFEGFPTGLMVEQYYKLLEEQENEENTPGRPGDKDKSEIDPGGYGSVCEPEAGPNTTCEENEAEWDVMLSQAEQAVRSRGELPVGLARLVSSQLKPKVSWRDVLREFIRSLSKNDFSWSPPNRRFIWQGIYLPGMRSEELGEVVIAIDTSSSIGKKQLDMFATECQAVLETYTCTATILYHDSIVQHEQHWSSIDGPLKLEPKGGGGTSHRCIFERVEQMSEPPVCIIALTDLYTEFPLVHPNVPTLWAVIGNPLPVTPFGRVLVID